MGVYNGSEEHPGPSVTTLRNAVKSGTLTLRNRSMARIIMQHFGLLLHGLLVGLLTKTPEFLPDLLCVQ